MRALTVLSFLIVCGCSDPSSGVSPGPTTSELAARLSVVEQENRAMRLALGASTMLGDPVAAERIAKLEAAMARLATGGAGKQLHLVVRETGEDLGVSADGALAAWSEKVGAVVDYSAPQDAFSTAANCTSGFAFDKNRGVLQYPSRAFFTGDGRLIRAVNAQPQSIAVRAVLRADGSCVAADSTEIGYPAIEVSGGIVRLAPETLALARL